MSGFQHPQGLPHGEHNYGYAYYSSQNPEAASYSSLEQSTTQFQTPGVPYEAASLGNTTTSPAGSGSLTPTQIFRLRDMYLTNHKLRTQAILTSQMCTSSTQAEYALLNLLEIFFAAFKSLVRTYARLGLGMAGIDQDDLSYEDDLKWMGAKTEIGIAGENLSRAFVDEGTGLGVLGQALGRFRAGGVADEELQQRCRALSRFHDVVCESRGGSHWVSEKTVLRSRVYAAIVGEFGALPVWHEDWEFVQELLILLNGDGQRLVDHDIRSTGWS